LRCEFVKLGELGRARHYILAAGWNDSKWHRAARDLMIATIQTAVRK